MNTYLRHSDLIEAELTGWGEVDSSEPWAKPSYKLKSIHLNFTIFVNFKSVQILSCNYIIGGDLGRTGGTVSIKISGGGLPMHPCPQYFEKYCYWMWGKVQTD